ncbi:MAG: hypothetical protein LHV69_04295 [Elusimicrobia bacterium]|nr:hypothetical protein [Candidatus Obscuribacterium magneticum]
MFTLRFDIHGLLGLFSGFFFLLLGLFVLEKNPRSKINQAFFLMTFASFFWVVGFGMVSLVKNPEDARFWYSFSYLFGVPFISPSVYLFSLLFAGEKIKKGIVTSAFAVGVLAMIPVVFFNPYIADMVDYPWGRYPRYTDSWLADLFLTILFVNFFLFMFLSFLNFAKKWRHERNPLDRAQARNILIAFLAAYTGIVDFATYFGWKIYPFGYVSLTFLLIVFGYSIIRHGFLNVKLVIKKLSLLSFLYGSLFLILLPLGFPLIRAILSSTSDPVLPLFLFCLGLGLVFSSGAFIYAYLVRRSSFFREQTMTGLTHELKSPLAAIESALDFLNEQRKLKPSGLPPADYLEMIERNSSRLRQFVDDLLQVFRVENKGALLEIKPTNLGEICRQVVESYRPLAEKKGNRLLLEGRDQSFVVSCDAQKIEQVVSNLVSNAVKFTEKGMIRVKVEGEGDQAMVSVVDDGKGIPADEQPHVFERFYQGTAGRGQKGTGVGLAIAKMWVDAHGGRLWVESDGPGKGSRFFFTLPLDKGGSG